MIIGQCRAARPGVPRRTDRARTAPLRAQTGLKPFFEMIEYLLKRFFFNARRTLRRQQNQTLPFGDYVSDGSEKARYLGFGKGSSIYDSALVFGHVRVGRDVWIGPFTLLDGSGGLLRIGDHCHVSAGTQIYTQDSVEHVLNDAPVARAPVTIGRRCHIGPNTIILKGVTIGDNVVIEANSVVSTDLPDGCRAKGAPAQPIAD
jgi:acetyltransferase-like isoleucine patch superfamily enzyme